jgi:hypothetical protein
MQQKKNTPQRQQQVMRDLRLRPRISLSRRRHPQKEMMMKKDLRARHASYVEMRSGRLGRV